MLIDQVTLMIKTFERPDCLKRCLESVRKYYPNILINVADDSKDHINLSPFNVLHLKMPFYSGSSAGRNEALKNVKTKYAVTMDDDFIFTEKTKLENWVDILEQNTEIDLVGGDVENRRYEGIIDLSDNKINLKYGHKGQINGFKLYDIVLQFFMVKSKKLRDLGGWDENQKTQDHKALFLKHFGKLNITHTHNVYCDHWRLMPKHYAHYRHGQKEQDFLQLMLEKYGANTMVEFGIITKRI